MIPVVGKPGKGVRVGVLVGGLTNVAVGVEEGVGVEPGGVVAVSVGVGDEPCILVAVSVGVGDEPGMVVAVGVGVGVVFPIWIIFATEGIPLVFKMNSI